MELKIKFLKWSAGLPVVMLNQKTADKLGVHPKEKVLIKTISKKPKKMFAITDIVKKLVQSNEIGVSSEIKKSMDLIPRQRIKVNLASSTKSLEYIKKKMQKKELSEKEIGKIIEDIIANFLSEAEIALFVSSMYRNGTSMKETVYLIKAILKTGSKLTLKNKFIVDKHSIGGSAGRTTPIVVSICAAAGLIVPKTSSRAITSPAGTADAIETMAKVDFTMAQLKKIIQKTNACLVWGGGLGMVPADSKIIKIEKQLKIDPDAQLLASIMAKKLAVGSKYIIIHIPYGKTAKVSKVKALKLKKKFDFLGRYFHKKLKCVLIRNKGPLGRGIGPVLEMMDVVRVLERKGSCHLLEKRSLELAGELFELTGKAKKGKGIEMAKEILDSKKALKKFKQILKAQKGRVRKLKPGKFKRDFFSPKAGKIMEIDNKRINALAQRAGCPTDKSAGIYLYRQVGNHIKRHEKIFTLYAESKSRINEAVKFYKKNNPIILK